MLLYGWLYKGDGGIRSKWNVASGRFVGSDTPGHPKQVGVFTRRYPRFHHLTWSYKSGNHPTWTVSCQPFVVEHLNPVKKLVKLKLVICLYHFSDYGNLKDHFQDSHYLCEEADCQFEQFSHAFASDIDLKAHRAAVHSKTFSKFQARQNRQIDVEINLPPRTRDRRGGELLRCA